MCGIVGTTDPDSFRFLRAMNDAITHRGPDDSGEYTDPGCIAMAMRRLSILDLENGDQPMPSPDGQVWIVFNGEIFNAPELRLELEARGVRFVTRNSDTEVLLQLYLNIGEAMLEKINGMFAFVIYDRREGKLFGARDRMGIKPLHYVFDEGRFAFASEIKSLRCLPWISHELDRDSVSHYLSFQFIPSPNTIYSAIRKLGPGECFEFSLEERELRKRSYWTLPVEPKRELAEDEAISFLEEEVKAAVKRWTLSDVPISLSLSGGLDSAALASYLVEGGIDQLRTFTVGFREAEETDESGYAKLVSEKWGTEHTEVFLDPEHLPDALPSMLDALDEPYGGGLPSWFIYDVIGREMKVCVTGSGGDELFGNYGKWRPYERSWISKWKSPVKRAIKTRCPGDVSQMRQYPVGTLGHLFFTHSEKKHFLIDYEEDAESSEELIEEIWRQNEHMGVRDAVASVDFRHQLPEEFLFVTDRFSMAHSVEARVPFLDHELVEAVFSLPEGLRVGTEDPKSVLRTMVTDRLPAELVTAPKRGFVLPQKAWLRGRMKPLLEELLSPDALRSQGLFHPELHHRVVRPFLAGDDYFCQHVWLLLMFQLWDQQRQK